MSYVLLILTSLLFISCASRDPASAEPTWKEADQKHERPEFMNRQR